MSLCYLLKVRRGEEHPFYYWRDTKGHEVDLVADSGETLYPVEIKSSRTFNADFIKNLKYLNELQSASCPCPCPRPSGGECIYAGNDSFEFNGYIIKPWDEIEINRIPETPPRYYFI